MLPNGWIFFLLFFWPICFRLKFSLADGYLPKKKLFPSKNFPFWQVRLGQHYFSNTIKKPFALENRENSLKDISNLLEKDFRRFHVFLYKNSQRWCDSRIIINTQYQKLHDVFIRHVHIIWILSNCLSLMNVSLPAELKKITRSWVLLWPREMCETIDMKENSFHLSVRPIIPIIFLMKFVGCY